MDTSKFRKKEQKGARRHRWKHSRKDMGPPCQCCKREGWTICRPRKRGHACCVAQGRASSRASFSVCVSLALHLVPLTDLGTIVRRHAPCLRSVLEVVLAEVVPDADRTEGQLEGGPERKEEKKVGWSCRIRKVSWLLSMHNTNKCGP